MTVSFFARRRSIAVSLRCRQHTHTIPCFEPVRCMHRGSSKGEEFKAHVWNLSKKIRVQLRTPDNATLKEQEAPILKRADKLCLHYSSKPFKHCSSRVLKKSLSLVVSSHTYSTTVSHPSTASLPHTYTHS